MINLQLVRGLIFLFLGGGLLAFGAKYFALTDGMRYLVSVLLIMLAALRIRGWVLNQRRSKVSDKNRLY